MDRDEQGHCYHLADATAREGSDGGGGVWDLTRKVAVVGAAATAAPVVAPPIILLSAAGLVLSAPFAAYLATLACTDRLMGALLPSFPSEPSHSYASARDDADDVEQEDEGVGLASPPPPPQDSAIPNVGEPVSFQDSGEESFAPRSRDKILDGTSTMEEKESTKQTVSLTSHVSGTPVPVLIDKDSVITSKVGGEVAVEVAVEEAASNADIVTTELVEMHVGIVAISSPENETMVETSYDGEMQETAVMEDMPRGKVGANIEDRQHHDQGVVRGSVSEASPFALHDHEHEEVMSSGSTQDIPDICDETSSQPDQETVSGYPLMKEGFEAKVISGDKHLYTEAQLREQLEAVRTITGYRSPASTLAGELAGLYLFVGVEPPVSSSRDASDLMEINAKLRLLKSIIGVD